MSQYRGIENGQDKAKAIAAVAIVHAALAAALLAGLNVSTVHRAIEGLKTFDVAPDPPAPPPPPPPPPREKQSRPKEAEGAAGKKAKPSPIVAPKPKAIPTRSPLPAAPFAGRGSASSAGASTAGSGTGAGGQGLGRGGGGVDYSKFTPAQRVSRIPDREYRRLVQASGRDRGSIGLTLKVNVDGRPSNCRVVRTSGDPSVDGLMCRLALEYVRFRPARDAEGRPIAQDWTWYPDWAPN